MQSTNSGVKTKALELPKESEMPARDKYTVFSPHVEGYRKGIHKVPKFTRVRPPFFPLLFALNALQITHRVNPRGF